MLTVRADGMGLVEEDGFLCVSRDPGVGHWKLKIFVYI